jgi:competence protein ComEC
LKRLGLCLLIAFLAVGLVATTAAADDISVSVDGKKLFFDVPPIIENDRTLVPLRVIFEALGAGVEWDGATQTVKAEKDGTIIKLIIGGKAYVNDQPVELDVPAKIVNDRTLVPLRFVSQALGASVDWDGATRSVTIVTSGVAESKPGTSGRDLTVSFIDVGQADCILVKAPGGYMLIDAGNNSDSNLVIDYIKKQGIEKLDVVVGTHPHEDHIGGLDAVINTFDIGKVYMPKVAHTTQTYEDVLIAIQNKGLKITTPTPGTTFNLGEASCTILAPNSSNYEDLNNYSIVIRMEYGNTSFLFSGDAEDISEREMLNKGFDLSADLLKVGHHGSDSSTTQAFLDIVNPTYAVVMVGKDNSYGHPSIVVMERLKAKGITVFRTDENGTIIAISDGNNINFNTKPGSYSGSNGGGSTGSIVPAAPAPVAPENSRIVYWTPNGKSYHYTDKCSTLSRSKTILSGPLSQCPKSDPCDRCVR